MKKKHLAKGLAICLALAQPFPAFTALAAEVNTSITNATGGQTKVTLDNQYWYKVKMPALINLTYDQDTVTYKDDYELQACGEIHGKKLQIETDDIDITGSGGKLTLENYIGRADKGEKNHKYVLGDNEGERELDSEWQTVNGLASHSAHGVKTGTYTGTANYKFKLVDGETPSEDEPSDKLSKESLEIEGLDDVIIGANQTKSLKATVDGEDVTDKLKWSTDDTSVARVNSDGTLITSGVF